MKSLMDSIKIIVTNSDTASIASTTLYQQAPNSSDCNGSQSYQDIAHLAQNNNAPKSLKSAKRWNLPPLKISTSEYSTLNMQAHENLDQSDEDDGNKPLIGPLIGKSFLASQSTTSLNSGKRVKLSPASTSSRTTNNIACKYC